MAGLTLIGMKFEQEREETTDFERFILKRSGQ